MKQICYRDIYQWHSWWVWYPVTFGFKVMERRCCYIRAWLEPVLRIRRSNYGEDWWEYTFSHIDMEHDYVASSGT